MVKYIYHGKVPCESLGRFGSVKSGDELLFTDDEHAYMQRNPDPRYCPAEEFKGKLPEPVKPADAKAEAAEKARVEQLASVNDAEKTRIIEIKAMTRSDLIASITKAKAAGKQVNVNDKMTRGQLVAMLIEAETGANQPSMKTE